MRWKFKRQSMVFLARRVEDGGVDISGGRLAQGDFAEGLEGVVGCCTIVLRVLDAALPE